MFNMELKRMKADIPRNSYLSLILVAPLKKKGGCNVVIFLNI